MACIMKLSNESWPRSVVSPLNLVFLFFWLAAAVARTEPPGIPDKCYLFSFFRNPGTNGLDLAWSRDGLKWSELKAIGSSFLAPTVGGMIMRDPCLRLGPDGIFRLVWTTSWSRPLVFGYASSRDLLHWSAPEAVPVFTNDPDALAHARNVWAPELFYDEAAKQWLIFWATTIPGVYPTTDKTGDDGCNHRIYYTTTKDFRTFAPTKLFYNGGFNVIDATMLAARGKYYLIVKDETKTPVAKHLRIAVGKSAEGPFAEAGPAISPDWVEGPSAIQIGDDYVIYFDRYEANNYGAIKSPDMEHWENITSQVEFPEGARHGTVIEVSGRIIADLMASAKK